MGKEILASQENCGPLLGRRARTFRSGSALCTQPSFRSKEEEEEAKSEISLVHGIGARRERCWVAV